MLVLMRHETHSVHIIKRQSWMFFVFLNKQGHSAVCIRTHPVPTQTKESRSGETCRQLGRRATQGKFVRPDAAAEVRR